MNKNIVTHIGSCHCKEVQFEAIGEENIEIIICRLLLLCVETEGRSVVNFHVRRAVNRQPGFRPGDS